MGGAVSASGVVNGEKMTRKCIILLLRLKAIVWFQTLSSLAVILGDKDSML